MNISLQLQVQTSSSASELVDDLEDREGISVMTAGAETVLSIDVCECICGIVDSIGVIGVIGVEGTDVEPRSAS